MYTVDLHIPPGEGIITRPVVGRGTPVTDTGFNLGLGCVSGAAEPVIWNELPEGSERVFFVAGGAGIMRLQGRDIPLKKHRILRVTSSASPALQSQQADAPLLVVYFSSDQIPPAGEAEEANLEDMEGLRFPARRWGRSITNGTSPVKAAGFTAGLSILEPKGGQVPWHNHPDLQPEVYLLFGGRGQMCIGAEVEELPSPAAVCVPGNQWHQLTNLHATEPLSMLYCYQGSVAAPHWWQEQQGVLPAAGEEDNPPLPAGAFPQCRVTSGEEWARIVGELF